MVTTPSLPNVSSVPAHPDCRLTRGAEISRVKWRFGEIGPPTGRCSTKYWWQFVEGSGRWLQRSVLTFSSLAAKHSMNGIKHRRTPRPTSRSAPKKKREPLRPSSTSTRRRSTFLYRLSTSSTPASRAGRARSSTRSPRRTGTLNRRAKRGETNLTYNGNPWNGSFIARNVFKVEHVRDHIGETSKALLHRRQGRHDHIHAGP